MRSGSTRTSGSSGSKSSEIARALSVAAQAVDRDPHEVGCRHRDEFRREGPGADASQLEHLVDQAFQAGGLGVRVFEELAPVGRVEPRIGGEERRARGLDGGERGPQVVGHRGEEPGARPVELAPDALLAGGGIDALELDEGRDRRREARDGLDLVGRQRTRGVQRDHQRRCRDHDLVGPTRGVRVNGAGALDDRAARQLVEREPGRRRDGAARPATGAPRRSSWVRSTRSEASRAFDLGPPAELVEPRDRRADEQRHRDECDEREEVVGLVDAERVDRRGEVVRERARRSRPRQPGRAHSRAPRHRRPRAAGRSTRR